MSLGDTITLSLVQMNSGPDRDANIARAAAHIDRAVETERPDLVVIPEFFNHPYVFNERDHEHLKRAEPETGPSITAMRAKAAEHRIHLIATLYEEESAGLYYDTAFVIDPKGAIVGKYRKVMPGLYLSLERMYFRFGSRFSVFQVGSWKIGIIICYDTFFPEHARCSAVNGAELIVVPFAAPRVGPWREMMITRAWENAVYFAPCNKVGARERLDLRRREHGHRPRGPSPGRCRQRRRRDHHRSAGPPSGVRGAPEEALLPRPPAGPLWAALRADGGHSRLSGNPCRIGGVGILPLEIACTGRSTEKAAVRATGTCRTRVGR